MERACN